MTTTQGFSSLSGFLYIIQKTGFPPRKQKKKWFFFFDEVTCKLTYYKSETGEKRAGSIDISDATLSFDPALPGQFVISCGGKEHWLVADSNEIKMHWLTGLQTKRRQWKDRRASEELKAIESDEIQPKIEERRMSSHGVLGPHEDKTNLGSRRTQSLFVHDAPRPSSLSLDETDNQSSSAHTSKSMSDLNSPTRQTSSDSDMAAVFSLSIDEEHFNLNGEEKQRTLFFQSSSSSASHLLSVTEEPDETNLASSPRGGLLAPADRGEISSPTNTLIEQLRTELKETKVELEKMRQKQEAFFGAVQLGSEAEASGQVEKVKAGSQADRLKALRADCASYKQNNTFLRNEIDQLREQKEKDDVRFEALKKKQNNMRKNTYIMKMSFVELIQKGIRERDQDDEEDISEDKGCECLLRLLREAHRESSKQVPAFETCRGSHVDEYGYVHDWRNEAGMQNYLCGILIHHYKQALQEGNPHLEKWNRFMGEHKDKLRRAQFDYKLVRSLVREGIPSSYREFVWKSITFSCVEKIIEEKGSGYYSQLCSRQTPCIKQIKLDLLRTLPGNNLFGKKSRGVKKLERILVAYSIYNPAIGYCQGMNMLAAVCLFYLSEEDAFWALVAIIDKFLPAGYYSGNLVTVQADQGVLKENLEERDPQLSKHIDDLGIDLGMITLNWFMTLYVDSLPPETMLRVWDCFLLERQKILFRVATALLLLNKSKILLYDNPIALLSFLKSIPKLAYDADVVMKAAFSLAKPIFNKNRISRRREHHVNLLKERMLPSSGSLHRTSTLSSNSLAKYRTTPSSHPLAWECGAMSDRDIAWLCQGAHVDGRIAVINVHGEEAEAGFISHKFDSRIICISWLNSDIMLLGTRTWTLLAFSTETGNMLWSEMLGDSPISLTSSSPSMAYAGLADGRLAYLEEISDNDPGPIKVITIQEGLPVSSLLLVNDQLWCGSGSCVIVLNVQTFEEQGCFKTDYDPKKAVSRMMLGKHGVWTAARGSTEIKLWHIETFKQIVFFDSSSVLYQGLDTEPAKARSSRSLPRNTSQSGSNNPCRVTSLLVTDESVWIGTGGGHLIVLEVKDKIGGCSLQVRALHKLSEDGVRCMVHSRLPKDPVILTCPQRGLINLWRPEEDEEDATKTVWKSITVQCIENAEGLDIFKTNTTTTTTTTTTTEQQHADTDEGEQLTVAPP